jgi:hypothetical protein
MRWFLPAALAVLLAGCAAAPPGPPRPPAVVFDSALYRGFIVPAPLLPFRLQGAVQLMLRGERESGQMSLQALPGPRYRLELQAPFTGAVALDVRVAPERLLVINYAEKTYLSLPNTPAMRLRLFQADLAPQELQTLLTGRVSRARFSAGAGTLAPDGRTAEFREDGAVQRFRLDAGGLPAEWVKERDGAPLFRVEFREYLEVPQAAGPPLRLPRKVRLYAGEGPPLLVVGVRSVEPGQSDGVAWSAEALPATAAAFAPGSLPEDGTPAR